jgi:hypothetical protein
MTILDLRIGDFVKIKEDLNSINDLIELSICFTC